MSSTTTLLAQAGPRPGPGRRPSRRPSRRPGPRPGPPATGPAVEPALGATGASGEPVAGRRGRAARRDEDFTAYLHARQPALLRTAVLLTGDRHTAEDVLQTALAKLYLSWDRVQSDGALDAYVRRIMVNEHTSLWRRTWKRREQSRDDLPEPRPHLDAYDDGTHDALWTAVQTLPRRARAVVVLRYYEQLSEAETAEVLGISVGTVKSQCSRSLAALRDRLPADLAPHAPADGSVPPTAPRGAEETR